MGIRSEAHRDRTTPDSVSNFFQRVDCPLIGTLCGLTLAACLGCEMRPAAISKILDLESLDTGVEVWSTAKVLQEYANVYQEAIDQEEALCDLIESLDDQASIQRLDEHIAQMNVEKLQRTMANGEKRLVFVKLDDIEYRQFEISLKGITEPFSSQFKQLRARAVTAFASVNERARKDPGLAQGLSRNLQVAQILRGQTVFGHGLLLSLVNLPMIGRLYPDHLRVTVVVSRVDGSPAIDDYLQEKTQAARVVSERVDEFYRIELSPVGDFAEFCDSIDIGSIQYQDESNRIVELELAEADRESLRAIREQLQDQQRQESDEKRMIAAQEKAEQEELRAADSRTRLTSKQAECESALSQILDRLQRINSARSCLDEMQVLKTLRRDFQMARADIERAANDVARITGDRPTGLYLDEDEWLGKVDEQISRLVLDLKIRAAFSAEFGRDLDAKQLLFDKVPSRGYSNPAEDPQHPDYVAANLLDVSSNSYSRVRESLRRLATIEPESVKDLELRKDMARAIRDVLLNGSSSYQADAIEPLSVWAGPYCVTVLGEVLETNPSRNLAEPIFETLSSYPSKRSAEIACAFVGHYSMSEAACKALLAMGAVAEPAVLEIAPTTDPKVCLLAVQLLSEIGTEDSLGLLRKGKTSTNPDVRQASAYATKQILFRTNQPKVED